MTRPKTDISLQPKPDFVRKRRESEFLPSALAVMETPASPLPWIGAWSAVTIFVTVLLWAKLSQVDIVAIAQGQVIPKGYAPIVQPLEAARVAAILVEEGAAVREGDPLVQLDTREHQAELARLEAQRIAAELTVARGEAILAHVDSGLPYALAPVDGATEEQVARELSRLSNGLSAHRAQLLVLREAITEQQSVLESHEYGLKHAQTILPLIRERLVGLRKLDRQGLVQRTQLLEATQRHLESKLNIANHEQKIEQTRATLAGLEKRVAQTTHEFRNTIYQEVEAAKLKVVDARQSLAKIEQRITLATIRSPTSGTVFQLQVNTVGGMVQAGQQLMTIVPETATYVIEGLLENKDIGFVEPGQTVQIKLNPFPYTRYGMLNGTVEKVARDTNRSSLAPRVEPKATENQNVQPSIGTFPITVRPDELVLRAEGQEFPVRLGMAAIVEIRIGQRNVLQYFLSPIMARFSEFAREK